MAPDRSINRIAWKLLDQDKNTNSLVSPLGLYVILEELAAGTSPGSESGRLLRSFLELGDSEDDPGIVSTVSDTFGRYWDRKSFRCDNLALLNQRAERVIREDYAGTLSGKYRSEVVVEDLSGHLEEAKKKVTSWVREVTDGQIPDYEPAFRDSSDLVLLNAIHLKQRWEDGEFCTEIWEFKAADGTEKEVGMLSHYFDFISYYEDSSFRGIFIPLACDRGTSGEGGMVLIIPSDGGCDGPERWSSCDGSYRDGFIRSLLDGRARAVQAVIPEFGLSSSYDLLEMLERLGLSETLGRFGLDRIAVDVPAYIISGQHQGVLEVSKDGLEASAVTEANIVMGCAPCMDEPVEFVCDVPFVVTVCDRTSGISLFAGYVRSPEAIENSTSR